MIYTLLAICLWFSYSTAFAEIPYTAEKVGTATLETFLDSSAKPGGDAPSSGNVSEELDLLPSVPCADIEESEIAAQCNESLLAYYQYYQFGLAHRQKVIAWQHFTSRIIFSIVLGLVLVGVYFAWRQFDRDMAGTKSENAVNSVEIGTGGVKVSSPVLGVIILALSLGFFYLYLVYVYPVIEII